MSFIDWSDPEDMFDLLVDYVSDERSATDDSTRRRFLATLTRQLAQLQERFVGLSPAEATESLRAIHRSVDDDFANDPVVEHIEACIQELERVNS